MTVISLEGPLTVDTVLAELPRIATAIPNDYLQARRWFASKTLGIAGIVVRDAALLIPRDPIAVLTLVDVSLVGGDTETYFLPLVVVPEGSGSNEADAMLVIETAGGHAFVVDGLEHASCCAALFGAISARRAIPTRRGQLRFTATPSQQFPIAAPEPIRPLGAEQSNTSVVFGNQFILKVFRRMQPGVNPELEIARFLTTRTTFRDAPALSGYAEYEGADGFAASLAVLQRYMSNEGDGWSHALAHLRSYFDHIIAASKAREHQTVASIAPEAASLAAEYLRDATELGGVTGRMHVALASDRAEPAFAPRPVNSDDFASWKADLTAHVRTTMALLKRFSAGFEPPTSRLAEQVLGRERVYRGLVKSLLVLERSPLEKIRVHGDFHLGQVLRTEEGFAILDFEGEPAKSLAERRAHHLAVKDIAGMVRSFDYAVEAALKEAAGRTKVDPALLQPWGRAWEAVVSEAYLDGYLGATLARHVAFLPATRHLVELAVAVYALDKALYEVEYEANNRPDWVGIPLGYLARM